MRCSPFPFELLFHNASPSDLCAGKGAAQFGSSSVTCPSPAAFFQVAGDAHQAPASTTACARTAFAATPAPAPRATRERTVLSVRHCSPSEKPYLLLS